jgi:hypothetical protein
LREALAQQMLRNAEIMIANDEQRHRILTLESDLRASNGRAFRRFEGTRWQAFKSLRERLSILTGEIAMLSGKCAAADELLLGYNRVNVSAASYFSKWGNKS